VSCLIVTMINAPSAVAQPPRCEAGPSGCCLDSRKWFTPVEPASVSAGEPVSAVRTPGIGPRGLGQSRSAAMGLNTGGSNPQ
jgi:hypothetical protein